MTDPYYSESAPGARAPVSKRPGTVTAGAVIAIVLSSLTAVLSLVFGVAFLANRDEAVANLEKQAREQDLTSVSGDDLATVATVFLGVVVVWALIAVVVAVLTLRGQQWARITLVVSSAVTALVCLVSVLAIVPVLPLGGAVATIVCLFTGGANEWFASRRSAPAR